jgi:hypothetical protein
VPRLTLTLDLTDTMTPQESAAAQAAYVPSSSTCAAISVVRDAYNATWGNTGTIESRRDLFFVAEAALDDLSRDTTCPENLYDTLSDIQLSVESVLFDRYADAKGDLDRMEADVEYVESLADRAPKGWDTVPAGTDAPSLAIIDTETSTTTLHRTYSMVGDPYGRIIVRCSDGSSIGPFESFDNAFDYLRSLAAIR